MAAVVWSIYGNPTTHASAELMELGMDPQEAEAIIGRGVLYRS